MNQEDLVAALEPIARQAGQAIMDIYAQGVHASFKNDGSPVTEADQAAEKIILSGLLKVAPEVQIISEENAESHTLSELDEFFLVDPLDGTKEFLKADGKGAFTVNIALVKKGIPVFGIVYAPALDRMFSGGTDIGATENGAPISARAPSENGPVAVASASHRDSQTDEWLSSRGIENTVSIGSSLKFCLVAAGEADVYPRFGPTMEWDTAAGDAILRAAGGRVCNPDDTVFAYGKANYRNGAFVAYGKLR